MAQVYNTIPKGRNKGMVMKYWTKAGPNLAGQTPCPAFSHIKGLRRLHLSTLDTNNTLLSPRLVPLLSAVLLRRHPTALPLPTAWVSLTQFRLHFHGFLKRPLWASMPVSVAFLNLRRKFHNPFPPVSFMTLKLEHCPNCQVLLPVWDGAWPYPWLHLHKLWFCSLRASNHLGLFVS